MQRRLAKLEAVPQRDPDAAEPFIGAKDVAALFGKSEDWVWRHARQLGGVKRFREWELLASEIHAARHSARNEAPNDKRAHDAKLASDGAPGRVQDPPATQHR